MSLEMSFNSFDIYKEKYWSFINILIVNHLCKSLIKSLKDIEICWRDKEFQIFHFNSLPKFVS